MEVWAVSEVSCGLSAGISLRYPIWQAVRTAHPKAAFLLSV
jgi:hypothetical protein